jgi:hypothetical protein
MPSHTCTPSPLCSLCNDQFACAADLNSKGPGAVATATHYECALAYLPDGSLCEQILELPRPPSGGYDCTGFTIGNASSKLANTLKVSPLELDATLRDTATTSCAAELEVKSTGPGAIPDLAALVNFTLKNKAGVAIPIHFTPMQFTSCQTMTECALTDSAFIDTELTACATAWGMPAPVAGILDATTAVADPTLSLDQLELFVVSGGAIYRSTRTAIGAPWTLPQIVIAAPVGAAYHTPKLSPDGLQMLLGSTATADNSEALLFTSRTAAAATTWAPPVPVVLTGTTIMATPSTATFGPGNHVIFATLGGANVGDLYEAAIDPVTHALSSAMLVPASDANALDADPYLTPDGMHLYFNSTRGGRSELYVASRRSLTDTFGDAVVLKELSGPVGIETAPWVAPGGHVIYFTSNRMNLTDRLFTATRASF